MTVLLLFPNNLFNVKFLPKTTKIYLLEDPVFFGQRDIKMKFNKLKLIMHRASMKYYHDYLKDKKLKVTYIDFNKLKDLKYSSLKKEKNVSCFELNDHLLEKRLNKVFDKIKILPNPNFILSSESLERYHESKKNKNKYFHKNFYDFVKAEINLLKNVKSYDNDNRKKLPKTIEVPKLPKKEETKYHEQAIKYVNKHFSKNYGSTELLFPITHKGAKKWVKYFCKKKLFNFGNYQDAIHQDEWFMFHSTISPMLNIGLINPDYVIKRVTKEYHENKKKIGINNYEGFIRQIIGWREYQRYCYKYAYNDMTKLNYFKHKKKLSNKWYTGETSIDPVDKAIKMAFSTGYLHHIGRLMIMSNILNLHRIDPKECYKWFMEFSVDSYDWVMIQNVYSMGQWSDGGMSMRKPYISSDNYILNMSNYKKGEWPVKWKALYYKFLTDHEKELKNTPYARNLAHWKKMSKKDQDEIKKLANKTIRENTK